MNNLVCRLIFLSLIAVYFSGCKELEDLKGEEDIPIADEPESQGCDYELADRLNGIRPNEFIYSYKNREVFAGRKPAPLQTAASTIIDLYRFVQIDNENYELCFFAEFYVDAWTGRINHINREYLTIYPDIKPPSHGSGSSDEDGVYEGPIDHPTTDPNPYMNLPTPEPKLPKKKPDSRSRN